MLDKGSKPGLVQASQHQLPSSQRQEKEVLEAKLVIFSIDNSALSISFKSHALFLVSL